MEVFIMGMYQRFKNMLFGEDQQKTTVMPSAKELQLQREKRLQQSGQQKAPGFFSPERANQRNKALIDRFAPERYKKLLRGLGGK